MSVLEEKVYLARVAEQCERYDDMIAFLKELKSKDSDLSTDERNLLSVAYKNSISSLRTAWRAVSAIGQNEKYKVHEEALRRYKNKIVNEMDKICEDVVEVIDGTFIKKAEGSESQVFLHKMKGDYYRYMAEVQSDDKLTESKNKALEAY